MTIEIWIPRPPDNANARQHWRKALHVKHGYLYELDVRGRLRLIPDPPAKPFAHTRLESHWYVEGRKRFLDQDNATRRLKPVIDWLVRHHYLAGDGPQQLQIIAPVQFRQALPNSAPPLTSVRLTLSPFAAHA